MLGVVVWLGGNSDWTAFLFGGDRMKILHSPRYCEEIRVFKAGRCLDTLAWNNKTGMLGLVGLTKHQIDRASRGHWYLAVRGEILGFAKD